MLKVKINNIGRPRLPDHLTIEIVDKMERFYAVRKEWLELEARAADPLTYFQSFDWCEKWCRIYAPNALRFGGSIHIALIRNNGKLAAVLPLAIENRKKLAFVLRFIGEPLIQYGKVLMDDTLLQSDELRLCLDQVIHNCECDAVYLDHLVSGSPLHNCLDNKVCYSSKDSYSSVLSLEKFQSGSQYMASLSRQARKSRRRKRRKLEDQGSLSFHVIDGTDAAFSRHLKTALAFKAKWLEHTGRPTHRLEDERYHRMLGELGVDTSATSGVVAFMLCLDGVPIAFEIGFWRLRHYYSFIGSYDWNMGAYSPGKLLLEDVIAWLIERDFKSYDLLGNPSEYKDAMSDERIPIVAFAKGKTLAGSAYASFWRPTIKPSVQQTIASLPVSIRQAVFGVAEKFIAR